MPIIDQSNWAFELNNTSLIDEMHGVFNAPTVLKFETSIELVRYMADDGKDDYTRMQSKIDDRIDADVVAGALRKARTLMKDLKHFPRYRKSESGLYHEAARACCRGDATSKQQTLADGLTAEIDASRVKVCLGQILFHGRADHGPTELVPYPGFISTSINPVVARMSAFRRAGLNQMNGRPTVYVLRLGCSLPALWGQTGYSHEYELLLPPLLRVEIHSEYSGSNFDVIEALVVGRR